MFTFGVLVTCLTFSLALSQCPSHDLVEPCRCSSNIIICDDNNPMNLTAVFLKMSLNLPRKSKHFYGLHLRSSAITRLDRNATADITFDRISITANNLTKIHKSAFAGTVNKTRQLFIWPSAAKLINRPKTYDIFSMIRSLNKLEYVYLRAPKITEIPSKAFGTLTRIKFLSFGDHQPLSGNYSLTIGDNAFYHLKKVIEINLDRCQISEISSKALRFKSYSTAPLSILLSSNQLTSESFANGSLSNFRRPTKLNFSNNQLTYLDEEVFRPFFDGDANNRISHLMGNPINCTDCRNLWLIKDKEKYQSRVEHAYCSPEARCEGTMFDQEWDYCGDR